MLTLKSNEQVPVMIKPDNFYSQIYDIIQSLVYVFMWSICIYMYIRYPQLSGKRPNLCKLEHIALQM